MDQNDRQAIERLFDRLAQAERDLPPRDPEAESLIGERLARNPGAAYYMAQTVVVQEQALEAAQARIAELEAQLARAPASGGFLGALFGGGRAQPQPAQGRPVRPQAMQQPQAGHRPGPWGGAPQRSGGSGFLAGAAQTAMGVAGGVLLGNAIAGMLSPDAAEAAEGMAEDLGADPAAFDEAAGLGDAGGFDDFDI